LGLPANPDTIIKEFLSSLDPSQDVSGPIPTSVPDMDMLDIHLTDLDLGKLFFYSLTSLFIIKSFMAAHTIHSTKHHSFLIQPEALRAPEVILGGPWGPPVDIWNLGCLVRDAGLLCHFTQSNMLLIQTYEMATSRSLFLPVAGISDEVGQLSRMVQFLGDFPPGLIKASSPFSLQYFESDGILYFSLQPVPAGLTPYRSFET
jgi:serine/threonine-protein kinase SRPK3